MKGEKAMKKKYYGVKAGRHPGIYYNWEDCKAQVHEYPHAKYRSFESKDEALEYVNGTGSKQVEQLSLFQKERKTNSTHLLTAYVDGSYAEARREYAFGCVFLDDGKIIGEMNGKDGNPVYTGMRNVAGEILGAMKAVSYAIENGYDSVNICYDYAGIQKWAEGEWKAKRIGTREYRDFMQSAPINITFTKIAAHTGETYNEMADRLAKKALGI